MTTEKAAMRDLLREARGREGEMVRSLGRFVRCESPSYDKAAVDRFGAMVASEWRLRGAAVKILKQRLRGDHLRVEMAAGTGRVIVKDDGRGVGRRDRRGADRGDGQILVLGHLDTVYPIGTIAKMPFRVAGGKAWGPGTFDMKGGLVLALAAVDALRAAGVRTRKRVVFLWTSDEEVGSETSRRVIESEARRSDAVLVLEPSLGREGRLKTRRYGVGGAAVIGTGRAAHAGNDRARGITVQATVVEGGTATNVVPERARVSIDIRFAKVVDAPAIEKELRGLRPILRGARVEVRMGALRPPLERTAGVRGLFRVAQGLMGELGLSLGEAATGGGV